MNINVTNDWKDFFESQINQEYFRKLMDFIDSEYEQYNVFPPMELVFNAFNLTEVKNIKAVIVGQDPYHEINQAMGLAFSVPRDEKIPPSLRNVYKEINRDLGIKIPSSGDLTSWAKEGIFMINTVLTVREHEANSHANKGWEIFTDNVISYISSLNKPIVYFLWGNSAKQKKILINNKNQLILESAHPSPLSANRGFFGCGHFSKALDFYKKNNIEAVNFEITN